MAADVVNKWTPPLITAPAFTFAAISLSDTVDETKGPFRAIYVGVGGDIAIVGLDNVAVTFKNAVTGAILPIMGRRVNSTNSTATNLVGIR